MANYKVLFWIALVIIVILLAYLYQIKKKIDVVKGFVGDIERAFYEMNSYLRERILGGDTEKLKQQFEYSVDKLIDAIKLRLPKVDVEKISSLKQIVEGDAKSIVSKVSSALNVPETNVSNFVTAVKNQIQNYKAGQSIATSIHYEEASNALGEIIAYLRGKFN